MARNRNTFAITPENMDSILLTSTCLDVRTKNTHCVLAAGSKQRNRKATPKKEDEKQIAISREREPNATMSLRLRRSVRSKTESKFNVGDIVEVSWSEVSFG